MHARWQRLRRDWITGGAHLLILAFAAQAESAAVWPWALAAMALISFAAWIANYRRLRGVADTPLSNIASAAQGYVEIAGRARAGAEPLRAPFSQTACVWYEFERAERTGQSEWSLQEAGASDQPFLVEDATGHCEIDPRGAEVVTTNERTWTSGEHRYTERLLCPQERVYGLGEFATTTAGGAADTRAAVGTLLARWKSEPSTLLARFDLDGDGRLDLREWELARRQALREVESSPGARAAGAARHSLRKPADGRLYVLSNDLPHRLQRRYALWAWAHAIVCIAASGTAVALL